MRRIRIPIPLFIPFLLLISCSSQPRVAGRYAVRIAEQTPSPASRPNVVAIEDAVVATLRERVKLVDESASPDAVIVLHPGPANSVTYEILRGQAVADRGATGPVAIPTASRWSGYDEKQEYERKQQYAQGRHSIVIRRDAWEQPFTGAVTEGEVRSYLVAAAQRVTDRIIRDLAQH